MNLFSIFSFFLEIGGYLNKREKEQNYLPRTWLVSSSYPLRIKFAIFVPRIGAKEVRTGIRRKNF